MATQNTLNYVLGNLGGKKKPWMTEDSRPDVPIQRPNLPNYPRPLNPTKARTVPSVPPGPPPVKRKRGRPPLNPRLTSNLLQQTSQHNNATGLASPTIDHRDSPQSSNSTSPQLANVVFHPRARPTLHSPKPVLPSPAPSEDANLDPAHTPAMSRSAERQDPASPAADSLARAQSPTGPRMEELVQLGDLREGPPKRLRFHDGQTSEASTAGQRPTPPITHVDNDQFTNPPFPVHGRLPRPPRASPISTPRNQQSAFRVPNQSVVQGLPSNYQQPDVQTTPVSQGHFRIPERASRALRNSLNAPIYSPVIGHTMPTPPGPLTHSQPDTLLLPEFRKQLFQFTHMNGNSLLRTDEGRLNVLKDALDKEDWFYLTMHQFYCLLDVAPDQLPQEILQNPGLHDARLLMRDVLDANNKLSPIVLQFFVNFPRPIGDIASLWYQLFQEQYRMFVHFMGHAAKFPSLIAACEKRMFPPLVGELFHDLGINSVIFQRITFTAILRRLMLPTRDPAQGQFESHAIHIFMQNQTYLWSRLRSGTENSTSENEYSERRLEVQRFASQYVQLCQENRRWLGATIPSTRPPLNQAQGQTLQQQPRQRQARPSISGTTVLDMAEQPSHPPQHRLSRLGVVPSHLSLHRPLPSNVPRQTVHATIQTQSAQLPNSRFPRHQSRHVPRAVRGVSSNLLPARGFGLPQQRQSNPPKFALHQAHLRSPVLAAKEPEYTLYQYLKAFARSPARLTDAGHQVEKWTIPFSTKVLQTIPPTVSDNMPGAPFQRLLSESSQLFRLRCIKWSSRQLPNEHAWAIAETSWIPYTYFTFNSKPLELRKKLHHGKDLPVDLTSLIEAGDNSLEIAIVRADGDQAYQNYLIAIEIVGTIRHETIKQNCLTSNLLPPTQIMNTIQKKLAGTSNDDDDDIAIVQSNLTISLVDPFSASKFCDIPVRGKSCLHNDCFDLDTFLQTRERKDDSSVVDKWRCPICSADARPQHLIVDGFLQTVYIDLKMRGLSDVRAIVVEQNGDWKPKIEPKDNEEEGRDSSASVQPQHPLRPAHNVQPSPADLEIIDLSD